MHLMVYAPYGRAGIYMLQEFCRAHRHPGLRRRDPRSRRRARRVAGRTSAGAPAARGPGLPAGGGAGRRPAEPAGSRVFSAAAPGLHRRRRAHVQPLGQAGAVQPSLRGDGAAPAGVENRSARTGRAICRCRTVSRRDDEPQRHRPPRRSPWPLATRSVFPAMRGSTTCPFECRTRSAFRSGCRRALRRS